MKSATNKWHRVPGMFERLISWFITWTGDRLQQLLFLVMGDREGGKGNVEYAQGATLCMLIRLVASESKNIAGWRGLCNDCHDVLTRMI